MSLIEERYMIGLNFTTKEDFDDYVKELILAYIRNNLQIAVRHDTYTDRIDVELQINGEVISADNA